MTEGPPDRTLDFILSTAASVSQLQEELRRTTTGLGILFVDLVGSTDLKHRSAQEEWLPVVARFLFIVSRVVTAHAGTVVKYIGDEVMAVFRETEAGLTSLKMEACLWNIEEELQKVTPRSFAKYSFDFGEAAEIAFDGFPRDYLGSAVDRCARIAKFAKRGTAVASDAYVAQSKNPKSWRRIGHADLRGFPRKEVIYQLEGIGDQISGDELSLATRSADELNIQVRDLSERLDRCMEELKVQQQK